MVAQGSGIISPGRSWGSGSIVASLHCGKHAGPVMLVASVSGHGRPTPHLTPPCPCHPCCIGTCRGCFGRWLFGEHTQLSREHACSCSRAYSFSTPCRALHPLCDDILGHLFIDVCGSHLGDQTSIGVCQHLCLGADLCLPMKPSVSTQLQERKKLATSVRMSSYASLMRPFFISFLRESEGNLSL